MTNSLENLDRRMSDSFPGSLPKYKAEKTQLWPTLPTPKQVIYDAAKFYSQFLSAPYAKFLHRNNHPTCPWRCSPFFIENISYGIDVAGAMVVHKCECRDLGFSEADIETHARNIVLNAVVRGEKLPSFSKWFSSLFLIHTLFKNLDRHDL